MSGHDPRRPVQTVAPDPSHAPERLFRNFGDERADADLDRTNDRVEGFFVQTATSKDFLAAAADHPFVVGPKGSGKSLLLFRKRLQVAELPGTIVIPRSSRAFTPSPAFATQVSDADVWQLTRADHRPDLAAWATLWEWALLTTVVAAWRRHEAQRGSQGKHLDVLNVLVGEYSQADPFVLISNILQEITIGHRERRGRAVLPRLEPLTEFIENHGGEFPPTYVFVDNPDDFFEQNPEFWIAGSHGALLAIQDIVSRSRRRIHCFLSLRPEVAHQVEQAADYPRWRSAVFRIGWTDDELLKLFSLRARSLQRDLLRSPELVDVDSITALLGADLRIDGTGEAVIRNVRYEALPGTPPPAVPLTEPASQHILRHTLRRPRDMIIVGNELVRALRGLSSPDQSSPHLTAPYRIRQAVQDAAKEIGRAYVAEVQQRWPWGADGVASIAQFLSRHVGASVINRGRAVQIETEFAQDLGLAGSDVRPFDVLASLGLVGFPVQGVNARSLVQRFASAGETRPIVIPRSARWLLIHPVLAGEQFDIRTVPGQLIGPSLPFDESLIPKEYRRGPKEPPERSRKGPIRLTVSSSESSRGDRYLVGEVRAFVDGHETVRFRGGVQDGVAYPVSTAVENVERHVERLSDLTREPTVPAEKLTEATRDVARALSDLYGHRFWQQLHGEVGRRATARGSRQPVLEITDEASELPWEFAPLPASDGTSVPLSTVIRVYRSRSGPPTLAKLEKRAAKSLLILENTRFDGATSGGVRNEVQTLAELWSAKYGAAAVTRVTSVRDLPEDRAFDIVHYAGHQDIAHNGFPTLTFDDGTALTLQQFAEWIDRRQTIPRLLFLNACATMARTRSHTNTNQQTSRQHVRFGGREFLLGTRVPSIVGTLWPVRPPEPAFVSSFYQAVVDGRTFVDAIHAARIAVAHRPEWQAWWPAYVLYSPS